MMLSKGSIISGQYDKAIDRLQSVNRFDPKNIDAILLLAEVYERMENRTNAVIWYRKSLELVKQGEIRNAIEARIQELEKKK